MNDYNRISSLALESLMIRMSTQLGSAPTNPYGVPLPDIDSLNTMKTQLAQKNAAVETAKAEYRAAVRARDETQMYSVQAVATIARTVFAKVEVSAAMIAALGLTPHSKTRTRVVPITPKSLLVTLDEDGAVRVKWDRNGNAVGVNFIVEAQDGEGIWTFQGDTTASKLVLAGFTPGASVNFRVTASKNGTLSLPSTIAVLYPKATVPALRIAA